MTNKSITNKNILFLLLAVGLCGFLGISVLSAHAQTQGGGYGGFGGPGGEHGMGGGRMDMGNTGKMGLGIVGKVTAVNTGASTITMQGMRNSTTSYTVDVGSGTIIKKDNVTSTISSVGVGDMVMVRGAISGTVIAATTIYDGVPGRSGAFGRSWNGSSTAPTGTRPYASSTRPTIPTVSGTVASVGGSTITVTGTNGTTYTVDVSNATLIKKGSATSSIAGINTGDVVQIQGNVSGTAVTATVVFDNVPQSPAPISRFFGAIKNFLGNLFHFKF